MGTELIQFEESRQILSKESTGEQIRLYFESILKLYRSNDRYPVDLDSVWMLVYSQRSKAVSTLKRNFIEGEDFVSFSQSVEREVGGTTKTIYKLSVSCMEYFIARKVRNVFNVYRDVFKKVATGEVKVVSSDKTSELELLVKSAQALLEQSKRIDDVESRLEIIEQERNESRQLLLAAELSDEKLPEESENVKIRKLVNIYVKSTGLGYEDVWNSIYETLEYRYGNRIKRYKKINSDKSWLDVAIRNNLGQKIYNVISDMVRNVQ